MAETATPPAWAHRLRRDAVTVEGPDAMAYLQGQVSQDVASLDIGSSVWSWVLAPAGKVDALVRVTRSGPDGLVVDTDQGFGDALLARLTRFKLRTRADFARSPMEVLAVRGPGASGATTGLVALWRGEDALDVDLRDGGAGAPAGLPAVDAAGWEVARISAGVPVMGAELTERTIPAETGLVAATVSFTKGCYTGQELVARIDSRGGNVARHLRLLRSSGALESGAELVTAGKVVGTITSAAPTGAGGVALAYVARSVEPGEEIDASGTPVTVEALAPMEIP